MVVLFQWRWRRERSRSRQRETLTVDHLREAFHPALLLLPSTLAATSSSKLPSNCSSTALSSFSIVGRVYGMSTGYLNPIHQDSHRPSTHPLTGLNRLFRMSTPQRPYPNSALHATTRLRAGRSMDHRSRWWDEPPLGYSVFRWFGIRACPVIKAFLPFDDEACTASTVLTPAAF